MSEPVAVSLVLPWFSGMLDPDDLTELTRIVRIYRVRRIRLSASGRIVLAGLHPDDRASLCAELGLAPDQPPRRGRLDLVHACPGRPWCKHALADTQAMASRLRELVLEEALPAKVKVSVAGCARCCSAPLVRDLGLTAGAKGWRLSFGGNAGGRARVADVVAEGLSDDEVVALARTVLACYARHGGRLRTARFMERVGLTGLLALMRADSAETLAAPGKGEHRQAEQGED